MALSAAQITLLNSSNCLAIEVASGDEYSGFVRAVHANSFEFDHITNPSRYFSNHCDPPEFERKVVQFADLANVRRV